jgi:hypothetical protein
MLPAVTLVYLLDVRRCAQLTVRVASAVGER